MLAAIFDSRSARPGQWLSIEEIERPALNPGHVLIKVSACGVCRTDLHIVERDLPPIKPRIIPGHQIVGEVVEGSGADLPAGTRVGVSWIGGVDGSCWYCRHANGEPVRSPTLYGVLSGRRLRGIRLGARRLRVSAAAGAAGRPDCSPVVRGHHRFSQPARRGRRARRARRPVWLRQFRIACHSDPPALELRGIRGYPRRRAPQVSRDAKEPRGWATKMQSRPSSSTAPSPLLPAEKLSSARCRLCAKAEWWRSMPFTSTRCPPSITTRFCGGSANCAAWPT